MDKIGWKVVRKKGDGTFESAVDSLKAWARPYAVGSRTTGYRGTPVMAFRTRRAARHFTRYSLRPSPYRTFRAQVENPRPLGRIGDWHHVTEFKSFWEKGNHEDILAFTLDAPEGTLACDAITLLEPA